MSPSLERTGHSRPSRRGGFALVIVLALVVVISLILVAFVTVTSMERSASYSYGQSIAAEQLAMGALGCTLAELQNEMGKDAAPDLTFPRKPLYTNVTSANIRPQPAGTNTGMPGLVKISGTSPFYSGSLASGRLIASGVSTTTPARNGRYIDTNRWNLPCLGSFPDNASTPRWVLITRSGATNGAGLAFGSGGSGTLNNPAPGNTNFAIGRFACAVYDVGGLLDVTRSGYPSSLTPGQVGQIRATLAALAMSKQVFSVDQEELLKWRNPASGASAEAFLGYVTNYLVTNTSVYPGDNTFLSRQDLIDAARSGVAGLSLAALPNLTVFSRDRNAPGWEPAFNASDFGGTNGAAYAYRDNALKTGEVNRFLPSARFSSATTVTNYRSDASFSTNRVEPGDPVVQRRFPLGCLAWIGPDGPAGGASAEAIQACFGLVWGPSEDPELAGATPTAKVWKYAGASGSDEQQAIKRLDEAAAEGRSPNFFELLQAGILRGSLGVNGNGGLTGSGNFPNTHQSFPVLQILRIGASMIDQADEDSYPTVIEYRQSGYAWQACGVESLPGIVAVAPVVGVPHSSPQAEGATSATAAVYLSLNLWNPHRVLPVNPPPVRVRVRGSVAVFNIYGSDGAMPEKFGSGNEPGYLADLDARIELSPAGREGFDQPSTILVSDVTNPGATTELPAAAGGRWVNAMPLGADSKSDIAAVRLPDFPFKLGADSAVTATANQSVKISLGFEGVGNPFNAMMEFQAPSGAWIPYQFATGINDPLTWTREMLANFYVVSSTLRKTSDTTKGYFANFVSYLGGSYPSGWTVNATSGKVSHAASAPMDSPSGSGTVTLVSDNTWNRSPMFPGNDPRSTRFNAWMFNRSGSGAISAAQNANLWSPSNIAAPFEKGYGGSNYVLKPPMIFGVNYFPAQLSRNNHGSAGAITGADNAVSGPSGTDAETSYTDNDGLRRIADSGLFTDAMGKTGNPFGRALDRPVVLNRPFRSVGELGFVFRDDPWRTLDLFSSKSADSALLDIFTIHDSALPVVAGKIDLNTKNRDVLQALLAGVVVDPVTDSMMSDTTASAMASAIAQFTSTNNLVNRSELASLVSPALNPANGGATGGPFSSNDDQNLKIRREAFVRALGDVTQTRTWNLMIDVIAQSGRYGPGATGLEQFTVEGERRYWLHVAIDRLTGEVLDQQLEIVTE